MRFALRSTLLPERVHENSALRVARQPASIVSCVYVKRVDCCCRKLALQGSPATGIAPTEPARCPRCGSVRVARGELLPRVPSNPFVVPVPGARRQRCRPGDTS